MKRSEFNYHLPLECIAQEPVTPRDHSRLLVLSRETGRIEHRRFFELGDFLRAGDVLVLNATRVFPARLRGKKRSGGKVEVLLLSPSPPPSQPIFPSPLAGEGGRRPDEGAQKEKPPLTLHPLPQGEREVDKMGEGGGEGGVVWRALVRGATQPTSLLFPDGLTAKMCQRLDYGEWVVEFNQNSLRSYLDQYGEMPLPPYIKRKVPQERDKDRYQTAYAREEGAVAAPTAGFHFTPELLKKLQDQGVIIVEIVLHVGWGTFRPVRVEEIKKHTMLPEFYEVSEGTSVVLNQARQKKRRILAVGTTVVRTLESICDSQRTFHAGQGETGLFIYPGYCFKAVDGLITNFHLPHSTPLLLASAFYSKGGSTSFSLRKVYQIAIREGYRFYSYGDVMFIL